MEFTFYLLKTCVFQKIFVTLHPEKDEYVKQ